MQFDKGSYDLDTQEVINFVKIFKSKDVVELSDDSISEHLIAIYE